MTLRILKKPANHPNFPKQWLMPSDKRSRQAGYISTRTSDDHTKCINPIPCVCAPRNTRLRPCILNLNIRRESF